jgi:carbamoyltransferase
VVVRERAAEFFQVGDGFDSPWMLQTVRARPEKEALLRGVIHRDGTARVQTVTREENPALQELLELVGERTGVPVLLNTSLNARNEPIVETPADALNLFSRIRPDALAMDGFLLYWRL